MESRDKKKIANLDTSADVYGNIVTHETSLVLNSLSRPDTDRSKRFEPIELAGAENSIYSPRDATNFDTTTAEIIRSNNTSITHKRGNRYTTLNAEMLAQKKIEETEANVLTQRQEALLARKK
jgi:hypothetical protein